MNMRWKSDGRPAVCAGFSTPIKMYSILYDHCKDIKVYIYNLLLDSENCFASQLIFFFICENL